MTKYKRSSSAIPNAHKSYTVEPRNTSQASASM